jgi:site-specific DNA-methyltransferase (adenine-specific)
VNPTVSTEVLMNPYFQTESVILYHGNCLEVMAKMGGGNCDAIVTDPAYWTLDQHRSIGTTARLGGHRDPSMRRGWFKTIDAEELFDCLCEFHRLLTKNGHVWIMNDGQTLRYTLGYAEEAGFNYAKPFPVAKLRTDGKGFKQGMGYHGRAAHEYIVLLEKGRRRFNQENWPDVFMVPWTGEAETRRFTSDGKGFPTAKPFNFFRWLLRLSTKEGETVLDPFAGSGTLGLAALVERRKAILIERDEATCALIARRLTATPDEQEDLFPPCQPLKDAPFACVPTK